MEQFPDCRDWSNWGRRGQNGESGCREIHSATLMYPQTVGCVVNICFISEVPEAQIVGSAPPGVVCTIDAHPLHIWKSRVVEMGQPGGWTEGRGLDRALLSPTDRGRNCSPGWGTTGLVHTQTAPPCHISIPSSLHFNFSNSKVAGTTSASARKLK